MKKPSDKVPKAAPQYDPAAIEQKWQKKWASSKVYKSVEDDAKQKYYVLDMFPYPSGEGLHVGHPKGYIATDIISRYQRMNGKSVLHPMGFDAFGLPAENYAIKTKTNPADSVAMNVARYKKQLEILGFDYDWSREVNTTDPAYYKWTQWIFLQLFKKGLAYESYEPINWCPVDKTGLANEDVVDGRCERCGALVEKRPMRQWVLKITDYADKLLADLDLVTGVPMVERVHGEDGVRKGLPFAERWPVVCLIKHWSKDEYLCAKWKATGWQGFVTGGIEKGETIAEAGIREIREETGYKNVRFVREGGKVDAKFYQMVKKINRHAHFTGGYFELIDGERDEISPEEKELQDLIWLSADKVRPFLTHDDMIYLWDLHIGAKKQELKPLLDWPESIKEAQRNWIGRSEGAEIDFRMGFTDKKTRFVLVHGFEGGPKKDFFPWMKAELEKRGHEVEVPALPDSADPKESEQVEYLIKNCKFDENTVVVAHSLGCVVALKALMKMDKPISGLVLVASAVDPSFDKHYESRTFNKNFNWNYDFGQINRLAQGRIAVLSDTAEIHRAPYLKDLSGKLSALLVETPAVSKHFTADAEPAVLASVTPNLTVFTTRPDTLFGVTYIVLAPEHPWVGELLRHVNNRAEVEAYILRAAGETEIDRTDATKEKTGVQLQGVQAFNPANGEAVPVWIADYVLVDYGTGAVMAVPAHDERDLAFAKKYKLPIRQVIAPETGIKRDKEEFRDGGCAVIFDPAGQKYAVSVDEGGKYRLFGGGVAAGEDMKEGVLREVREESGLHDFDLVQKVAVAFPHFYNTFKKVNRIARATCFVVTLKSAALQETKLEEHEKFTLKWVTAGELKENFNSWNQEKDVDHWLWFLNLAVSRLTGSGVDTTSDKGAFKVTAYTGGGKLINSASFDGMDAGEAKKPITAAFGRAKVSYKLRDWVFSRQRYWGEPIPLIHCDKCGVVPVPEKDLPVKLPKVASYEPTGTGESPLAAISEWVNVKCSQCRGKAKRETNTMPQWAGSSWYYLRFADPKNKKAFVGADKDKYWSPVDMYVGGAEHATRHLIYARFWHKFLYDQGLVSTIEPFIKLQSVGLIMGEDGRKMSKRFGNVVNPDDMVKTYGADTLRVFEMFMGPFDQAIPWSTESIIGSRRFIERVWKLREKIINNQETITKGLQKTLHKTIKKVSEDIMGMRFNTAISSLMIAANEFEKSEMIVRADYESYIKLLAPFAPHVAEELWISLGNKKSIHISEWPVFDPALVEESEVQVAVQVNGKVRGSFMAAIGSAEDLLRESALALPEVKKWTEGKEVKKVIVIKGKIVSIVVS